ncbi:MAG: polyhydroxyalkanoate synthesis repressor PhaR [Burkholderiales bacterium]|nr:polyhydroxyalkanoate synthesis repressor PhaR [Burkholderiales bacterium]
MSASRLIKKYPNRRLYDTEASNYITLSEVKTLVLANIDFRVVDAKSSEDLTRSILLQIILEEETAHGAPMFTSEVLAQVIRFYGHAMQGMMGSYLEKSIQTFIDMQRKLQEQARVIYEAPKVNAEVWGQFFKNPPAGMPNLMGSYMEQSAKMFLDMQEQMRKQALTFFGGFPPVAGGERDSAGQQNTPENEPPSPEDKTPNKRSP